jgi:hypothetical protein
LLLLVLCADCRSAVAKTPRRDAILRDLTVEQGGGTYRNRWKRRNQENRLMAVLRLVMRLGEGDGDEMIKMSGRRGSGRNGQKRAADEVDGGIERGKRSRK